MYFTGSWGIDYSNHPHNIRVIIKEWSSTEHLFFFFFFFFISSYSFFFLFCLPTLVLCKEKICIHSSQLFPKKIYPNGIVCHWFLVSHTREFSCFLIFLLEYYWAPIQSTFIQIIYFSRSFWLMDDYSVVGWGYLPQELLISARKILRDFSV